jgi:acetylornithine deacetylase/succinyl-diaminopimelate desuccinylase-like protein
MKKIIFSIALACIVMGSLFAQPTEAIRIREYVQDNEKTWLKEYLNFIRIPNLASDKISIQQNATFIMDRMKKSGIQQVQLLEAGKSDVPPAIYGEVNVPGATQTVVFYAHYDGQPVDSAQWLPGWHPFKPLLIDSAPNRHFSVIKNYESYNTINPNWRITGRGSADDKAGIFSIILAYESLRQLGITPTVNLRFFFEGEEEAGSTHLADILTRYAPLLKSDGWIICDGPEHPSGRPVVYLGVRGDAGMELTVYGSNRPLHSGHYGNWAPNPAFLLSRLLASMKDDDGNVLIKGFYDQVTPLTEAEKKVVESVPMIDSELQKIYGFKRPESPNRSLAASLLLPSLNIDGIQSAATGKLASNIIPSIATATLDLRLVAGVDYQKQQQLIENHIREQGYFITGSAPTEEERARYDKIIQVKRKSGYNAQRTPLQHPFAQKVIKALNSASELPLVISPSMGGSLPLFIFEQYANALPITVPVANFDNNQHAENENMRIGNLWSGIRKMAGLMRMTP